MVLAILAVGFTVALARSFLLPITFAWLGTTLLAPVVRRLRRIGLPRAVGAALVLALPVGAAGWAVYQLSGPANQWAQRLPEDLAELRDKIQRGIRSSPLANVDKATKAVAELADTATDSDKPIEVSVVAVQPSTAVLTWLQDFGVSLSITLVLIFLLLAIDDPVLPRILSLGPGGREDPAANRALVQSIEGHVARYLATITVTNLLLGVTVGLITWLGGLPNPALWGAMAALVNFVPYLGAVVGVGIVALVGVATHTELAAGLAPAVAYAAVNTLEGMLITPTILGRQLDLSPVVVFVWLLLLGWLWDIPGALLAVPLLATAKIASDHLPALAPLRRLLGRRNGTPITPWWGPLPDAAAPVRPPESAPRSP